jgi:hypothetical protein
VRLSPVEKNIRRWRPEFGPEGKHFVTGNSLFFVFGGAAKLQWAGGRAAPVGRGNEPKKTGARSARPRTRGQKPTSLGYFVCVSVCHNCGTLSYSFSFSNQTDQGDQEKEGLDMER